MSAFENASIRLILPPGAKGLLQVFITGQDKDEVIVGSFSDVNGGSGVPSDLTEVPDDIDKLAKDMDKFYIMAEDLTSKGLISTIDFAAKSTALISEYTYKPVDLEKTEDEQVLCSNDGENELCCHISLKMTIDRSKLAQGGTYYKYLMVAFSGLRSFVHVATGGLENCGVVACPNGTIESCGSR